MSTATVARGFGAPQGVKGTRHHTPRAVTRGVVPLVVALLMSSCGVFRPSAAQQCRTAQGLITKAVRLCPEAAELHHDTLRAADIDSIAAACAQFREALEAERQLGDIANGVSARILLTREGTVDSLRAALAHSRGTAGAARSVNSLRQQLCTFEAIHDSTALHDLRISWSPSGVSYTVRDFPRTAAVPTTHQTITNGTVIAQGGTGGWLMAVTALGWLLAVVFFLCFKSERYMRLNSPKR